MNNFIKYIFSRFVGVFLLVFFLHWIFNLTDQLYAIFDVSGALAIFVRIAATIIIGLIGFISINSFFLFMNKNKPMGYYFQQKDITNFNNWKSRILIYSEYSDSLDDGRKKYNWEFNSKSYYCDGYAEDLDRKLHEIYNEFFRVKEVTLFEEVLQRKNSKLTFWGYFRIVFSWRLSETLFNIERKKEKYTILFLILLAISIWFIKGNPIINNYYGLYKSFKVETRDGNSEQEYDKIIVSKDFVKETINKIESDCEDYEDCDVRKRGYVFVDAGVFDGFVSLENDVSFFRGFAFALLERLIHTLMYFLLPFLIGIFIIRKVNKQ